MRQFVSAQMPDKQGHLAVTGKDFRYLVQVLRVQVGEGIDVRLCDGSLLFMIVDKILKKSLILQKGDGSATVESGVTASQIAEVTATTKTEYWLFQFMTKPQKMDIIIRQAVESGVSVIVPVIGAFCTATPLGERTERWQKVIREARQQSGSPVATRILQPMSLPEALELWRNTTQGTKQTAFVLYEKPEGGFSFHEGIRYIPDFAAIAVGPEGGIRDDEINTLCEKGFIKIHLETNILRAETAAIYGLASLRTIISEYEKWHVKE